MRAVALVLLVGCGRVAFDSSATNGDARSPDSPAPTCIGVDADADGFPDACDLCPVTPDPQQLDGDGDGVGDACDPRPTLDGDYIAILEMHDTPAAIYEYFGVAPVWTGSSLELGSDTASTSGEAAFDLPANLTRFSYRAHVVGASSAQPHWFSLWYDGDNMPSVFAGAGYDDTSNLTAAAYLEQLSASGVETKSAEIEQPGRFVVPDTYDITVTTQLATTVDDVLSLTHMGRTDEVHLPITIPLARRAYFEAARMKVDFDYLIVYATH